MHSRVAFPAVSAALLASFASALPSGELDARTQCYSGVYTLIARGTYEPQGGSVLDAIANNITAAIPGSGSNEVVYPAASSFYPSVPVGVVNVQQQMHDYYSQCPDGKMIIMGYSQGAYVMSVGLAGGEVNGQNFTPISTDIGKNIAAVVMFGDPSRNLNQGEAALGGGACSVTSPLARTGAQSTAMQFYAGELQDWCAAADPICCKTGNNIQAHLDYWSTNTTDTVVSFVKSKVGSVPSTSSASSTSLASSTSSASASPSASSSVTVSTEQTPDLAAAAATPSVASHLTEVSTQAPASTTTSTSALTTASPSVSPSASPSTAANGVGRTTIPTVMAGVSMGSLLLSWLIL